MSESSYSLRPRVKVRSRSETKSALSHEPSSPRPRAFQRGIDEPCTLPLSPPKGWHKNVISLFVPVKFNFSRKKSVTKFLCVKTSSGKVAATSFPYPTAHRSIAGDVPVYLKLAFKVTHPFRKRRFPKLSFRVLQPWTSDCEVAFQLLPDSVACEHSLFIDCGCAVTVRRFCPNMSLQQVHARKYLYMYLWSHAHSLVAPCWIFNVCDVVVKQLLGLPQFQNLLLIVYDHISTICAIIQRLCRQNKLW